jgi:hypothetical protein
LFLIIFGSINYVNNCAKFQPYTWHTCQPSSLVVKTANFEAQGFVNFTTQPGNCSYWNVLAFQCSNQICVDDMTQKYSHSWDCATPHPHDCSEIPGLDTPSDECGNSKLSIIAGCILSPFVVLLCVAPWYKFTKIPLPNENTNLLTSV